MVLGTAPFIICPDRGSTSNASFHVAQLFLTTGRNTTRTNLGKLRLDDTEIGDTKRSMNGGNDPEVNNTPRRGNRE